MIIRCIVIDDEPLALGLLVSFIERTPGLELCARFPSAIQALQFIHDNPLELIFLDIHMPDLNGIELARIIDQNKTQNKPRIIFTTAYDNYAIEGFRVDALDYLVKPFNYVDFSQSIYKAKHYFDLINKIKLVSPTPLQNIEQLQTTNEMQDPFIYIRVDYQMVKISKDKICYIEGLKDYVKIYLDDQDSPLLSLISLKALNTKLDPNHFMRIHRSYIISLNKISAVTKNSVTIKNQHFKVTEGYKTEFDMFLERWK